MNTLSERYRAARNENPALLDELVAKIIDASESAAYGTGEVRELAEPIYEAVDDLTKALYQVEPRNNPLSKRLLAARAKEEMLAISLHLECLLVSLANR